MTKTEMNPDLRYQLVEGATTVKNLQRLLGKSETWVRTQLKDFGDEVLCKKNSTGQNVFWIDPKASAVVTPDDAVAGQEAESPTVTAADPVQDATEELASDATEVEATNTAPADETPSDEPQDAPTTCPLCNSAATQKPAGEAGSFLGACLTCPDCHKTYNSITRTEVKGAASAEKGKRVILNPQHKIRAKVEAAEKVGGSLKFDKTDRRWSLQNAAGDDWTFTAETFAVETPETILARMG